MSGGVLGLKTQGRFHWGLVYNKPHHLYANQLEQSEESE